MAENILEELTSKGIQKLLNDCNEVEFFINGKHYTKRDGIVTHTVSCEPIDKRITRKKTTQEFKNYITKNLPDHGRHKIQDWEVIRVNNEICCIRIDEEGFPLEFFTEKI